MINIIFLDDNIEDYCEYTSLISNELRKLSIPHRFANTYEQSRDLMNLYWHYLKEDNETELNNEIRKLKLLSENTICFIDDNWENTSSTDNCDGKNFVLKFLNNNVQQNIIMVTVSPDSYGTAYIKKDRKFASNLSIVLQKVTPIKIYLSENQQRIRRRKNDEEKGSQLKARE